MDFVEPLADNQVALEGCLDYRQVEEVAGLQGYTLVEEVDLLDCNLAFLPYHLVPVADLS